MIKLYNKPITTFMGFSILDIPKLLIKRIVKKTITISDITFIFSPLRIYFLQ